MSNSVVKVADSTLNDSLLLLVGEDGTITPTKDVVEAYLNSRTEATNLQLMHISKTDDKSIEVAVNNMLYMRESDSNVNDDASLVDEIAYNLYNIKLDHDYTCQYEPVEEVDELAKTLSILEGSSEGTVFTIPKPISVTEDTTPQTPKPKLTPSKKSTVSHQKKPKPHTQEDDLSKSITEDEDHTDTKKVTKKSDKPKDSGKPPKQAEPPKIEKSPQDETKTDKKVIKKDKKPQKTVPDDFALFSTPDIIRRVGGKETPMNCPSTSQCEAGGSGTKPARIEIRSKSVSDSTSLLKSQSRLSLDGKISDKQPPRLDAKSKRHADATEHKKANEPVSLESGAFDSGKLSLQENDLVKAYGGPVPPDVSDLEPNMTLDGNGLELDPSLLDTINNDMISDDILYQVAQSLVSNTELQHAIDKSLKEDGLGLQGAVPDGLDAKLLTGHPIAEQITPPNTSQKGTQIVRPDGRIVVIPPIERPTTRSRNKKTVEDTPSPKFTRKPLDEEHVSGNELDSSDAEEEESEDDPNKLWCICNQPHNNRFMICCDTCEEWYHGKCVNITKAMGQQMESEGREWICLFCKDPLLRRPQAAAKRIRKASRNSRQSSDSNSSSKMQDVKSVSVPCVVCHKPSRSNSIFCSETCILAHAQGVERVVVFERATGNMLTGNKAPSASNLEEWLKDHPGYEVVRSAGKIVTTKSQQSTQSKLKILKNFSTDPEQAVTKRKHLVAKIAPKTPHVVKSSAAPKPNTSTPKVINRQVALTPQREKLQSSSSSTTVSSPAKVKVVQTSVKTSGAPIAKDKPSPAKVVKVRQPEQASPSAPQNKQENIRDNVQKTIFEQLTNRLKVVDDLKLSEEELKSISTEIESQLYKCFGDTGQKYRNKYRSLIFNIKDIKNQTLWRRICEKSVNPYQLVRLSPDDLASQELALWREREAKHQLDMIKKSELELLKCNRQYVLKTHKGEQILEDNRPTDHIDNSEVITGLTDASGGEKSDRKRDTSRDSDKKNTKHGHRDRDRKSSKDKSNKAHRTHRSSSRDHDRVRKRSRSRDKNSKHSERRRSRSRGRDRHRRSSHKSSRHKKGSHRGSSTDKLDKKSKEILEQLVDNKIVPPLEDRLWKHVPQEDVLPAPMVESDSDHEPTSTVTIPTPPRSSEADEGLGGQAAADNKSDQFDGKEPSETDNAPASPQQVQAKCEEIWRGVINMIDVAQISITAHEVSGDCNGLAQELPPNLDIVGRISPDTVWDYIGKMKCSNSKIISIVRLNAINIEEKMPYLALYSYLSSRNRLGVVKSTNKAVKDFYILPLASQKPIPQALLPLNGPGFEEARPALLLGIIVRDKRKRPFIDPLSSVAPNVKKTKIELPPIVQPARSYTPPPLKDSRLKLLLPPSVSDQDGDEPYSPEDSDPDNMTPSTSDSVPKNPILPDAEVKSPQTFQPFANKFDDIPGLDNASLPSSTQEIQRQMEKLNKEIEMQKSEINSISQNIATASTEIGTAAFADIALPSNLQQILDRIKTIGSTPNAEATDAKPQPPGMLLETSDFTIPLILPTNFSRQSVSSAEDHTIPLNLPVKKKSSGDKSGGVLSSLTEEDLIRKAEEMLQDSKASSDAGGNSSQKPKTESGQPPIPGLDDPEI